MKRLNVFDDPGGTLDGFILSKAGSVSCFGSLPSFGTSPPPPFGFGFGLPPLLSAGVPSSSSVSSSSS